MLARQICAKFLLRQLGLLFSITISTGTLWASEIILKGKILSYAGGCISCHTDTANNGALLAGGKKIKTPFGTFISPNITPDKVHGIGKWSERDFIRAVKKGISPRNSHYFPVFPYTSFSLMRNTDIKSIMDYIFTLPAVPKVSQAHKLRFPYNVRLIQVLWKFLYFSEDTYVYDSRRSAIWNRGAYLSRAVVHCGECHTSRTPLGGINKKLSYAGIAKNEIPFFNNAPNITSHLVNGIGKWSVQQIMTYLETGEHPSGDFAGSSMAEVIENGTGKLSEADRKAIAIYIKSIRPIP